MSRTRKRKFGSTFIFVNCFDSFGCGGGALSNPIPIFLSITILILCLNQLAIYTINRDNIIQGASRRGWMDQIWCSMKRCLFIQPLSLSLAISFTPLLIANTYLHSAQAQLIKNAKCTALHALQCSTADCCCH